jgi:hypothetical protein
MVCRQGHWTESLDIPLIPNTLLVPHDFSPVLEFPSSWGKELVGFLSRGARGEGMEE